MTRKKELEVSLEGEIKMREKAEARLSKCQRECESLRTEVNAWGSHVCTLGEASIDDILSLLKVRLDAEVEASVSDPARNWTLVTIRRALAGL